MSSPYDSQCANIDRLNQLSNPIFQISCGFAALSALLTFCASFYAARKVVHKSIFHSSTKILLIFNILLANAHQFMWLQVSTSFLYRAFFKLNKPCELMYAPNECSTIHVILMTSISGMVFVQTGLMIERTLATFYPKYSKLPTNLPGIVIVGVVLLLSLLSYSYVTWDGPNNDYIFSCGYYPVKTRQRANTILSIFGFLTLFNLLTSIAILRYNSAFEYRNRFNLAQRFGVKETIDATTIICFLTLSEFVVHFIYSFGILIVRLNRHRFENKHNYFITLSLFYTLPYGALLVPLLLIIKIRKLRQDRLHKIHQYTQQKHTIDEHLKQIQDYWKF